MYQPGRPGAKLFKKGAKGGNLRPKRGQKNKILFEKSNDILQI
jgi:hypothetical protein